MLVKAGDINLKTYFKLRKKSDGTAATGLTPANFDLQYVRSGENPSTKVDATALVAPNSAHADNKVIEVDATDQPGLYRVDWPDAAIASGVREVICTVKVATAFAEELRITLDAETAASVDLANATDGLGALKTLLDVIPTTKTGYSLSTTGLDAISSTATGVIQIAKAFWDRVISKANHNIANSGGKIVRQLRDRGIASDGTAQAGSTNTITLVSGASAIDNFFKECYIDLIDGLGAGQARMIIAYDGSTKIATVHRDWLVNPDSSTDYITSGNGASSLALINNDRQSLIDFKDFADAGYDPATNKVTGVLLTDTTTTLTNKTGFSLSTAGILAIWDQLVAAVVTASTVGKLIIDFLDAAVSSRNATTPPTAIENRTEMDDNSTKLSEVTAARMAELDPGNMPSDIDSIASTVAALNNVSAADVLTQVNAALDTAISELSQGQPTATPTVRTGLMLLYMALRNRLEVNTSGTDELAIYNDAGIKIAKKLLTDSNGDYSEDKTTSGA